MASDKTTTDGKENKVERKPRAMVRCENCGDPFVTEKMLRHIRAKLPDHIVLENLCHACRRAQTARRLSDKTI